MRSRWLGAALLLAAAAGPGPVTPDPAGSRALAPAPPVPLDRESFLRPVKSTPGRGEAGTAPSGSKEGRGETPERRRGFRGASADYVWSFPRDHWVHPEYRNEWWYFTGTLTSVDDPARRFGYQLTFFRVGIVPERPPLDSAWATAGAVMAHAAVGDLARGRHTFTEVLWRATPLLGGFGAPPEPLLAWARAPAGTPGSWTLRLEDGAFRLAMRDDARGLAFDLVARPTKPPALQGPNGLSRKAAGEGYASLYYSQTRLATDGTLTLDGRAVRVRGESWMDKEFGSSQLAPEQVGWDWFSLRLADGRDLMLYVLRRADGSADWRNGTLVERDGTVRLLGPEAWTVRPRATWRSRDTGATYPSGWDVEVPSAGLALRIEPVLAAQENRSALARGLFYWEGAVSVRDAAGRAAGEGYVELTGYGEGNRPPI
jgi:predicted secreted hydrolase